MSLVIAKPASQHKKSFLILVIISLCIYGWIRRGEVKGATSNLTAAEVISVTNAIRQQHGLEPLHPQYQLMRAAEAKANAMIAANTWAHNTPSQTPWDFIDSEGYTYLIAGENLAKGYSSAEAVVDAWLKSPAHRENLLHSEYTDTGIAVVEGNLQNQPNTVLVVQYVATRLASSSAATSPSPLTQLPLLSSEKINHDLWFKLGRVTMLCLVLCAIYMIWKHREQRKLRIKHPSTTHWRR